MDHAWPSEGTPYPFAEHVPRAYFYTGGSPAPLWSVAGYNRVSIPPDGSLIACSAGDNVALFNASGSMLCTFPKGGRVIFSRDGSRLFVGGEVVLSFLPDSAEPLCTWQAGYGTGDISVSSDGKYVAVVAEGHGLLLYLEPRSA